VLISWETTRVSEAGRDPKLVLRVVDVGDRIADGPAGAGGQAGEAQAHLKGMVDVHVADAQEVLLAEVPGQMDDLPLEERAAGPLHRRDEAQVPLSALEVVSHLRLGGADAAVGDAEGSPSGGGDLLLEPEPVAVGAHGGVVEPLACADAEPGLAAEQGVVVGPGDPLHPVLAAVGVPGIPPRAGAVLPVVAGVDHEQRHVRGVEALDDRAEDTVG